MRYGYLLGMLGLALLSAGAWVGGWAWLAVWIGADFVMLGYAHIRGLHTLFGKRPDGTLPWWSWFMFLPMLAYLHAAWHLTRVFARKPAWSRVDAQLVVGRRLLASEADGTFDNYVDLTAEFAEPAAIRRSPAYRSFPILNDAGASPDALRAAVHSLKPGRTYVHCGRGYSRSALFAVVFLVECGAAQGVEDALKILVAARPGMRLNREQQTHIQGYAKRAGWRP
jgi:hypothetical protein